MSDDLISRQAAIEAMRELPHEYNTKEQRARTGGIAACQTIIRELPSVQPKTGHWIEDAKTYYGELKKRSLGVDEYTPYFTDDIACSECLAKYSVLDNETQFFKYCPNCGAKMEEPENDN